MQSRPVRLLIIDDPAAAEGQADPDVLATGWAWRQQQQQQATWAEAIRHQLVATVFMSLLILIVLIASARVWWALTVVMMQMTNLAMLHLARPPQALATQ